MSPVESRGLFISVEGGEGAGKTSALAIVANKLEDLGLKVRLTREPGGVRIAERIRSVILDVEHTEMDALTEAFLYASARRQHLVEVINPALERGEIVICDRFIDSSVVYQGYARGLGMDRVRELNNIAIDGLLPHITYWFDVDPNTGLERVHGNNREVNRLDLEADSFHRLVYQGYSLLHQHESHRIVRIDANGTLEDSVNQLHSHLTDYLHNKKLSDQRRHSIRRNIDNYLERGE